MGDLKQTRKDQGQTGTRSVVWDGQIVKAGLAVPPYSIGAVSEEEGTMTLKRTKRVTALFFPEEWADITRAALAAGLKPGTYIRFKTLEAARKGERLSKGFAMGQEMLEEEDE